MQALPTAQTPRAGRARGSTVSCTRRQPWGRRGRPGRGRPTAPPGTRRRRRVPLAWHPSRPFGVACLASLWRGIPRVPLAWHPSRPFGVACLASLWRGIRLAWTRRVLLERVSSLCSSALSQHPFGVDASSARAPMPGALLPQFSLPTAKSASAAAESARLARSVRAPPPLPQTHYPTPPPPPASPPPPPHPTPPTRPIPPHSAPPHHPTKPTPRAPPSPDSRRPQRPERRARAGPGRAGPGRFGYRIRGGWVREGGRQRCGRRAHSSKTIGARRHHGSSRTGGRQRCGRRGG